MKRKIGRGVSVFIVGTLIFSGLATLVNAADPSDVELEPVSSSRAHGLANGPIEVRDDVAFVGDYVNGTVTAFDVSDPNSQSVISVADNFMYGVLGMRLVGGHLFVVHYTDYTSTSTDRMLTALDVSDPASITPVGSLIDPAIACTNFADQIVASSSALFTGGCSGDNEIISIDISDPTSMSVADVFDYSPYGSSSVQQAYKDLRHHSSGLYLEDIADYLYVKLDTSDPYNLAVAETVDGSGLGQVPDGPMYTTNNYVYFLASSNLVTVDVSAPTSPVVVDTDSIAGCEFSGASSSEFISGAVDSFLAYEIDCDLASTFSNSSVEEWATVNISDPANPQLQLGPMPSSIGAEPAVDNGKLYVFDFGSTDYNQAKISVYDVSNINQAPQFLGTDLQEIFSTSYYSYQVTPSAGSDVVFRTSQRYPMIRAIDTSDPSSLEVISDTVLDQAGSLPEYYQLIKAPVFTDNDQYMLLTEGDSFYQSNSHLSTVDISDPADMQLANRVALPADVDRIFDSQVVNNTWYVVANSSVNGDTLYTYQVNDTNGSISLLDSQVLLTNTSNSADRYEQIRFIEIIDDTAMVFRSYTIGGIELLDVSNPSAIGAPTSASFPSGVPNEYFWSPFTIGSQLFVIMEDTIYSIDASNPASLTVSSSYSDIDIDGPFSSNSFPQFIEQLGLDIANSNSMYFTDLAGNIFIEFDVSSPANFVQVDKSSTSPYTTLFPEPLNGFDNLWPGTLFIDGVAYGASGIADSQMYSVDANDLANPQPLDTISYLVPLYAPSAVGFYGNYLLVGSPDYYENNLELAVFDNSDPADPQLVGAPVHDFDMVKDIEVQGDYAYATRWYNRLSVFDLSNPTFPLLVYGDNTQVSHSSDEGYDLDIAGNYLYVADESNGLVIYDISTPDNPAHVASYTDANFAGLRSLEVSGNYVYGVSNADDVLMVLDVSNPASPTTAATVSDAGFDELDDIKLVGDRVYITGKGSTSGANFSIIDISTPASPSLLGSLVTNTTTQFDAVEVYDQFAFVAAAGDDAVHTIDLEDEANPAILESTTSGSLTGASELEINNDQLYVLSSQASSMNIYDISLASSPGDPGDPGDPDDPGDPGDTGGSGDSSDPDSPSEETLAATGLSNQQLLLLSTALIAIGLGTLFHRRRQPVYVR